MSICNEELAQRIKSGDTELIGTLWEQNKRIMYKHSIGYYYSKEKRCVAVGITLDDLLQESFFVILEAVNVYDEKKEYKFLTYIKYNLLNRFNTLLGIRGNKTLFVKSLNSLVGEDSDVELIDLVEDTDNIDLNDVVEWSNIKYILLTEIHLLEERQKKTLLWGFYNALTDKQIADKFNVSNSYIHSIRRKALNQLRKRPVIIKLGKEFIRPANTFYQPI